ncbi:hypothetical protein SCHPADRAFT_508185 [Schizopora paradoxa]|uniref:Uncharacterized protein n=1 Tax=Schizopora paradoxa TaxID=27342 RepID=A0A0H2RMD7_9AGAM|nr:hypothetical protein SCHPADRAFT_508185 [Schizopora paradoxa]
MCSARTRTAINLEISLTVDPRNPFGLEYGTVFGVTYVFNKKPEVKPLSPTNFAAMFSVNIFGARTVEFISFCIGGTNAFIGFFFV